MKPIANSLKHLILAALLGDGDMYKDDEKGQCLYVNYSPSKTDYLQNYILHNDLEKYVDVKGKTGELFIHNNDYLQKYYEQWFKEKEKIFSNQLNPKLLTYQSIILWINLFGSRSLDSVVVSTTVIKPYLRNLSYCVEKHINTTVVPGKNALKIHDIEQLFINTMKISINDSSTIATFLTQKEFKKLTDITICLEEGEII
ncbi:hypothetical protein [Sutcliffiella cohnii]|uniref:hypothetical protein n=1 Tax=Sutcliffiella cohnii TaxID=33932 RepID=UPI00082E7BB0|nr:hypothetical protein [Sutcliffiella cohnii]